MTPEQSHEQSSAVVADLSAKGVDIIRLVYADLHGIARSKDIGVREFERGARAGFAFCQGVFLTTLRADVVDGPGGPADGLPDLHARIVPGSLVRVIPWEAGVAVALADTTTASGQVTAVGPRNVLARVVQRFTALGLSPTIGPELVFYLCRRDEHGRLTQAIDRPGAVYTNGPSADPGGVVLRMMRQLAELELGVFAANHEFSPSQYEINIWHSDALDAADRCFLLKTSIKDIAALAGLHATFMGKPFNDQGGSGFHIHISLATSDSADEGRGPDGEDANAFDDPDQPDGLSPTLRHFVAGVLEHAAGVTAILNPTVNSYKRIQPDSLAPCRANWGLDNRTTLARVPPDRGAGTRVEIRSGDGAANPYLAVAAVLAAGLDGIERGLEPPAGLSGWTYAQPGEEAGPALPGSLGEALDALDVDATLRATLGDEFVDLFLTLKRDECDRYARHVTDWELDEYAAHL